MKERRAEGGGAVARRRRKNGREEMVGLPGLDGGHRANTRDGGGGREGSGKEAEEEEEEEERQQQYGEYTARPGVGPRRQRVSCGVAYRV